jgi:hypothetical protein
MQLLEPRSRMRIVGEIDEFVGICRQVEELRRIL